jgi:hypothetical protein
MSMIAQKHKHLQEAIKTALDDIVGENFHPMAEAVLTKVVCEVLRPYQQKVNAGMQDSLNDLLSNFKQKMASEIIEAQSGWMVKYRDRCLFPPNCRYFYSKGDSTVVIIEQQPQVRSLLMRQSILGDRHKPNDDESRIPLALPYVYFFLHFKYNPFDLRGMYSFWSNSTITKLSDLLNLPILPNIHQSGLVCMGSDVRAHLKGSLDLCDIATKSIDYYWNSCFTNDLSDQTWWKKASIDPRLATARIWSQHSLEDPTFILGINYRSHKSVEAILQVLTGESQEPVEIDVKQKIAVLVDECVESLYASIMRHFKRTKFEKNYPKDVTEQLIKAIITITAEINDTLLALEHEINNLTVEVKYPCPLKKCGELWRDPS